MTTPLRMTTPSANREHAFILSRCSNLRPTPYLVLDDVPVYRIAIMRQRRAKCPPHPHLQGHNSNPSGLRSPLSSSKALSGVASNKGLAELSTHRMAGAPSPNLGGPPEGVGAGTGGGRGVISHCKVHESCGGPAYSNRRTLSR